MSKLLNLFVYLTVNGFSAYILLRCNRIRPKVGGLLLLSSASAMSALIDIIFIAFNLQTLLKLRLLYSSVAKFLAYAADGLEYVSIVLFIAGVIRLTKYLQSKEAGI